jgi:hypothetical protein
MPGTKYKVKNVDDIPGELDSNRYYAGGYKFETWTSRKYFIQGTRVRYPMNWAVVLDVQHGIFIHAGPVTWETNGGGLLTAACTFYRTTRRRSTIIDGPKKIQISYPWAGPGQRK